MKQDAEIRIIGRQRYEDGQRDKTEQSVRGRFYLREGRFYLQYREPGQQGETPVTVKAEPGQASVLRGGPFRSQLFFCPGKRMPAAYPTPFGSLDLEVETHSLDMGLTQQGGRLEIRYSLFSQGRLASSNRLTIQVTPLPPAPGQGAEQQKPDETD